MRRVTKRNLVEFMKSQAEIGIEVMKLVTMNKQSIIEIKQQLDNQQAQIHVLAKRVGVTYDSVRSLENKQAEPKLKTPIERKKESVED